LANPICQRKFPSGNFQKLKIFENFRKFSENFRKFFKNFRKFSENFRKFFKMKNFRKFSDFLKSRKKWAIFGAPFLGHFWPIFAKTPMTY